tara:strand:- start:550 stop:711 length:162 start_codon:yes stop_codon:yes gene_type:complete
LFDKYLKIFQIKMGRFSEKLLGLGSKAAPAPAPKETKPKATKPAPKKTDKDEE